MHEKTVFKILKILLKCPQLWMQWDESQWTSLKDLILYINKVCKIDIYKIKCWVKTGKISAINLAKWYYP